MILQINNFRKLWLPVFVFVQQSYSVREGKGGGKKRGRKPLNLGAAERIEQSRQSARECRARKKLRYQYVEELVTSHEKAISSLRLELEMVCIFL